MPRASAKPVYGSPKGEILKIVFILELFSYQRTKVIFNFIFVFENSSFGKNEHSVNHCFQLNIM